MRPLRDIAAEVGGGNPTQKQSLQAVEGLWNEWEIHCLILASFGLQVFLFFTAGMRRHSVSRILNSLIWLAYLSADFVAIFILGHLAVHASSSHHLLIFWAPFLLLHLGGQDTITAFSMQDNELWRRHLLGLVTQALTACYVISISSWQDSRLLAATVLMFLSGVFKYIGRTLCLFASSPDFLGFNSALDFKDYVRGGSSGRESSEDILKQRVHDMMLNDDNVKLPPPPTYISDILLDSPLNDRDTIEGADIIPELLNVLKSSADRSRAYVYVSALLVREYELVYTKFRLHSLWMDCSRIMFRDPSDVGKVLISTVVSLILSFLVLFPLISALITLELFMVVAKAQLYNQTDVTVSYILLIGAILLELASLFMSILSYFASSDAPKSCTPPRVVLRAANYIHPAGRHRKQWSKMLAQYSMMTDKHKTFSRIAIGNDLEELVLDKLLDLGTGEQGGWNFASFRGQLALQRWTGMRTIIDNADLPTSVLIWHIATEICYSEEESITGPHQTEKIRVSRELSNYMMYLVFTCGVMLTRSSKHVLTKTHTEFKKLFGGNPILVVLEATSILHEVIREGQQSAGTDNIGSHPVNQVQLLKNNMKALDSRVYPRAFTMYTELNGMPRDDRWDLITEVWLEMLFYIAPRCGGAFHAHHLSTGGEFVTHVLQLMHLLGPFLPLPDA
ncbi:hypothetical protein CFC21_055726 [Triticum aestivum]|uniref:DUF4220 domain-containing protein n=2 Tax=Triticum aestivum TaxID=4565 RepID=A0A3B6I553_WHEAT|nr:uncharacterized protein LOC123083604 [Triticum aestivum]KAF7046718.1 hypothetical protein CFC21_055726 [Triticum aestivum]